MKNREMIKYLGMVLLALIAIYFVYFILKRENLVEGLENKVFASESEFIVKALQQMNEQTKDELLISKYKTNYEGILREMDEWSNLSMLQTFFSSKNGLDLSQGLSDKNIAVINKLNDLKKFKKTISESLDYLEANK